MFDQLLARVGRALDAARIPYMVIGGQAVMIYGEPRLTKDIDITLGVSLESLDAVVRAAGDAGLQPLVDPQAFAAETLVPRDLEDVRSILAKQPGLDRPFVESTLMQFETELNESFVQRFRDACR